MPVAHLRICASCDVIRYAPCGTSCGVPYDQDPNSWRENLQRGAGTLPPGQATPVTAA
ncbi:MAG: hypothetical protein K0U84_24890 [Actinomycetia bacterium]|nr:hypothetical protein [Actinomycetes bacterium]